MCTVSWLYHPGGYQLFCNRDEKHHRLPALPPLSCVHRGMQYVAPVDGDAGGTWLAVNEAGLTLCLLNGNTPAPPEQNEPPPVTSKAVGEGFAVTVTLPVIKVVQPGEGLVATTV